MTHTEDPPEFDFGSDIGYALWRENLSRGKRKLDLEDCRAIGGRVLEHLLLSNVELLRKPASTPPALPVL
jgi:hypothetical protein